MKKIALILCLMLSGATLAQAQITTGENTSQIVRTGNRAEKGDFGLYLGATTTMFKNITSSGTDFTALPLINLKYMVTDKVEARLGIEWWKKSDSTDYDAYKTVEKESSFMFYPGVAYHFNRSNLLDVYVGGELPFGWGSNGTKCEYDGESEDTDLVGNNFNIGLGAFIGLQAYICNLPLALGIEYGVSLKYCHAGDGILSKDGMSVATPMNDVKNNKFNLGNQARLTLTYFFKL